MLLNWEIPLPPLVEQERIVKLLDEADELRKLRTQADCRIADLIPTLFHEMFGDTDDNSKDLPVFSVWSTSRRAITKWSFTCQGWKLSSKSIYIVSHYRKRIRWFCVERGFICKTA
jgi:restriction endonuclease S subunit